MTKLAGTGDFDEVSEAHERHKRTLRSLGVADKYHDPILNYVLYHLHPGGFFQRFFSNDLMGCLIHGPAEMVVALRAIAEYVYGFAPAHCWGSKDNFERWLASRGAE